jgi:peptidoglycan/xylan/chitin deacetylase (PgdA/CDA1 family)
VVVPVFHAVLPPGVDARGLDPAYVITTDHLAAVLDYFLGRGFTPIGLPRLLGGLDPTRNYVMFTFDDGYANNLAAIDLLEQAGVPAMLSVNLDIVRAGESFWWDVLYRELRRRGASPAQIARERDRLLPKEPATVRQELAGRFGEAALRPCDEYDRPLTVAELRALASRPSISLANHTSDHWALTARDRETILDSLRQTQLELQELSGERPSAVTYPFGQYDEVTLECCRSLQFEVGFTGEFGKARLPESLRGGARMRLPRCVIFGDRSIAAQCESTHMDWRPSWTIRRWTRRLLGHARPRTALP